MRTRDIRIRIKQARVRMRFSERVKTFREWSKILPYPYRVQFINNTTYPDCYTNSNDSKTIIELAFVWTESPEGHSYWAELCSRFE